MAKLHVSASGVLVRASQIDLNFIGLGVVVIADPSIPDRVNIFVPAGTGGGWIDDGGVIRLVDPSDQVVVGALVPPGNASFSVINIIAEASREGISNEVTATTLGAFVPRAERTKLTFAPPGPTLAKPQTALFEWETSPGLPSPIPFMPGDEVPGALVARATIDHAPGTGIDLFASQSSFLRILEGTHGNLNAGLRIADLIGGSVSTLFAGIDVCRISGGSVPAATAGEHARLEVSGGIVASASSLLATCEVSGGVVTFRSGLTAMNPSLLGGTITENAGLTIEAQTAGLTNWSIYSSGAAPSIHAGQFRLGNGDALLPGLAGLNYPGTGLFWTLGVLGFAVAGAERARLNSAGEFLPPADASGSLGVPGQRWNLVRAVTITSGDIELEAEDGSAAWTLREQPEFILAINRKTGKRYRIAMEELPR